jgi:hypothetical protein
MMPVPAKRSSTTTPAYIGRSLSVNAKATPADNLATAMGDKGPALDASLVKEFVLKAHSDLETVKRLLEQEAALLNAAWDWGGGDWETALGAASHTGRRDIALFLVGHGAPLDIFAAAMLGETDVVRAMLARFPGLVDARGPHGIPLRVHAEQGGEEARAVLELLEGAEAKV